VWLGSFIGVLIIPAIMLGFARLKQGKTWLRVIAGLWAFGGGIYPALNHDLVTEAGGVVAAIVGVVWAILQDRKSRKALTPIPRGSETEA